MIAHEGNLRQLPSGWTWTSLVNCVDILDSIRVPINSTERESRISGKPPDQLYPYYGATGQVGWIDDFLFDEELILLGEDGAPFLDSTKNKAYLINGKSWVNNHAHVLRALFGLLLNPLLCHYLNTFDFHGYVTGTTRLKLNQAPMRQIPVPLPPFPEQQRIVTKIEELFTNLDAGVEALRKIQAQIKRYRQAVLKYAFEGKLTAEWREAHKDELEPASVLLEQIREERKRKLGGKYKEPPPVDTSGLPELPEGWAITRLGAIADINKKKTEIAITDTDTVSFVPMKAVEALTGGIDLSEVRELAEVKKGYTQFFNGDILFAKITPCMENGKVAIADNLVNGIGYGSTEFHVIRLFTELQNRFFFFFLIRDAFREEAERNMSGSAGQLRVPPRYMENVLVAVPPIDEQVAIVDEIDMRFSVADKADKTIEQSIRQSDRLRQSILKRAFEGKLVPQDPNDEPADKLLERINEERAKQAAESKKMTSKKGR